MHKHEISMKLHNLSMKGNINLSKCQVILQQNAYKVKVEEVNLCNSLIAKEVNLVNN